MNRLLDNVSPVCIPLSESSLFIPKSLNKVSEGLSYLVAIVQIGGLLVVSFFVMYFNTLLIILPK